MTDTTNGTPINHALVKRTGTQFLVVLRAANNETLFTSERLHNHGYALDLAAAVVGIENVRDETGIARG